MNNPIFKKSKIKSFSPIYISFFSVTYILYFIFLSFFLVDRSVFFSLGLTTILFPAIELGFFCCFGLILWNFRAGIRGFASFLLALALPFLISGVYLAQSFSAYISGHYISLIALENIAESEYVTKPIVIALAAVAIFVWLCFVFLAFYIKKNEVPKPISKKLLGSFCVFSFLFILLTNIKSQARDPLQIDLDLVPITALTRNIILLKGLGESGKNYEERISKMMKGPWSKIYNFKSDFPFLKNDVYNSPLPFPARGPIIKYPNVIVFFMEGLSARFLGTYHSEVPNLTPHMDRFAKQSLVVDNYFNHTAPSFRGVKGQLASGYPRIDGNELGGWTGRNSSISVPRLLQLNYQTVPKILIDHGYTTDFVAGIAEHDNFNNMLRRLGFQRVYNNETLSDLVSGKLLEPSSGTTAATDADVSTALIQFLKQKEQQTNTAPFFLSTYNIGTHAFLEMDKNGVPYGDGTNPVLNRIHNFDFQLGRFLNYFLSSPLSKNTILILTTDHSTFPEPPVVKILNKPGYKPYFIDQIPFIIYDKRHSLPARLNAEFRTSVDFAPTLLHLLSIDNVQNSFIGHSLFETQPKEYVGLGAVPKDFFRINQNGIQKENEIFDQQDAFQNYKNLIEIYWYLERQNRISP